MEELRDALFSRGRALALTVGIAWPVFAEGKNKELRELAQQTLPLLQDHLHVAQNVQSALGGK